MAYSETRIVIGGLAHVPILIFIANFIKGKFGIKTGLEKDTFVKEEPVKIIEVKGKVVKEGKAKAIKEISNKLDSIEQKADEVFEKVKKNKDPIKHQYILCLNCISLIFIIGIFIRFNFSLNFFLIDSFDVVNFSSFFIKD